MFSGGQGLHNLFSGGRGLCNRGFGVWNISGIYSLGGAYVTKTMCIFRAGMTRCVVFILPTFGFHRFTRST